MELGLVGKGVIVTGGSKGIGRSTALAFAREGARVAICARGAEPLERTASELRALGSEVHASPCDVADPSKLDAFLEGAKSALGSIHVLVNNTSGFGLSDDPAGWQRGFDVDVMATVRATWKVVPWLVESGGGAILHVSSIAGLRAGMSAPYGAVKAAMISHAANAASKLASKGIRVNAVAPGAVEFPGGSWDAIRQASPKMYEGVKSRNPFKRLGTPEEIADVIVFLCSDVARWVTGQTIVLDGGDSLR